MIDTPRLDGVLRNAGYSAISDQSHARIIAATRELVALKTDAARVEKLHAALTRLVEPRQGTYIVSRDTFIQCPFCTKRCDVEIGIEPVIEHHPDCPVVEALAVLLETQEKIVYGA